MLVNTVVYTFPAERADEAAELLRQLSAASETEAACISFEVTRGIEDPTLFVLYEKWADQAGLDVHYTTEHFQKFGAEGIRTFATGRTVYRTHDA